MVKDLASLIAVALFVAAISQWSPIIASVLGAQ